MPAEIRELPRSFLAFPVDLKPFAIGCWVDASNGGVKGMRVGWLLRFGKNESIGTSGSSEITAALAQN
jgi:hypothetical protein